MALGNNNTNNNKLLILKVVTKDAEKKQVPPHFSVSTKADDGKWTVTNQVKDISGDLVKVETEKKEWEGQEYDVIKVYLADDKLKETYLLDLRQNMLARNIYNSFAGLKSFENIEIGLYEKTKGEKTFPAVSIKQNGTRVDWKFKLEELPKLNKVKVGKKEIVDSAELDEFFIKELEELSARVSANKSETPKTVVVEDHNGDSSDIPF